MEKFSVPWTSVHSVHLTKKCVIVSWSKKVNTLEIENSV